MGLVGHHVVSVQLASYCGKCRKGYCTHLGLARLYWGLYGVHQLLGACLNAWKSVIATGLAANLLDSTLAWRLLVDIAYWV